MQLASAVVCCVIAASAPIRAPPARMVESIPSNRVSLAEFAASRGMLLTATPQWTLRLRHALADIAMEADSRQIRFNAVAIWLNDGVRRTGNEWTIAEADANSVLAGLLDSSRAPEMGDQPIVLLDPGHGGNDTGTGGTRRYAEKRLNMDVARGVHKRLSSCGITVLLSRQRDVDVDLARRTQLAAAGRADCFVSIHMNSAANRAASGIESYVLTSPGFPSTVSRAGGASLPGAPPHPNGYGSASMLLAYDVHRGLLARTGAPDRGIRHARFEVLREAPCPAILVECGFVSNAEEANRLVSPAYQDRLADGIAQGILTYVSRCQTQTARRRPPPTQIGSDPEIAQTDSTDHAAPARPPDGTAR